MDVIRDSGSAAPEVPGYDVGRLLGRGGTAAVWLVTERSTGREFALKCFDAGGDATDDAGGTPAQEAEEALRREVRILSALDHDHLLRVHTVLRLRGPWSGPESRDALGLVLDYAPGGSVAELVAGRGRLGAGETVTVLTPIAQALEYLHSQGFTHGDVSPGNVLFTAHGKPLLADVGVARMVADVGSASVAGTEGFSDPAPVDAVRAGLQPERDVYSLAALGWYCLTGRPPGPGARRPPLPLLVPDVPAALAAALEAGLDEDRRQRPSAAELAAAVYRSAAAEPVDLSVTAHPTVVPDLLTRRAVPRNARERRAERLRRWFRRWHRRPGGSRAALTGDAARPPASTAGFRQRRPGRRPAATRPRGTLPPGAQRGTPPPAPSRAPRGRSAAAPRAGWRARRGNSAHRRQRTACTSPGTGHGRTPCNDGRRRDPAKHPARHPAGDPARCPARHPGRGSPSGSPESLGRRGSNGDFARGSRRSLAAWGRKHPGAVRCLSRVRRRNRRCRRQRRFRCRGSFARRGDRQDSSAGSLCRPARAPGPPRICRPGTGGPGTCRAPLTGIQLRGLQPARRRQRPGVGRRRCRLADQNSAQRVRPCPGRILDVVDPDRNHRGQQPRPGRGGHHRGVLRVPGARRRRERSGKGSRRCRTAASACPGVRRRALADPGCSSAWT